MTTVPSGGSAGLTRRDFVRLAGGALVLAACSSPDGGGDASRAATTAPAAPPPTLSGDDGPFWLQGNFAPVAGELEVDEGGLEVVGEIPAELRGLYVRNGPNQQVGDAAHWFVGDGMLHGVWLGEGTARRYRRRWTATPVLGEEGYQGAVPGGARTQANVSLVHHADRLFALGEVGYPYEIATADLATVGPFDFAGRLTTNMTAHPKIDPDTGDMYFFGYGFAPPFLTLHHADATGRLLASAPVDLPQAVMMHDFALTATSVVILDLPVALSAGQQGMPFRWDADAPARIGVVDRDDLAAPVRWVEIEPCYVFHTINAHDGDDGIVLDAVRYPHMWMDASTDRFPAATAWRWELDMAAGTATETQLDDRTVEFPQVDRRFTGRAHGTSFAVQSPVLSYFADGGTRPSGLVRYDGDGGSTSWDAAPHLIPDEGFFVATEPDADEGQGWLLSMVYDAERERSSLTIFDAEQLDAGPAATVQLPERVPFGFHGWFVPLAAT